MKNKCQSPRTARRKSPTTFEPNQEQKLSYFGPIKRHNTLEKLFLEGTCGVGEAEGRPRRRWTQDIGEWMGVSTVRLEDKHLREGSSIRQFGRPRLLRIAIEEEEEKASNLICDFFVFKKV